MNWFKRWLKNWLYKTIFLFFLRKVVIWILKNWLKRSRF